MTFLATLLWAVRTVLGLFISGAAALLAYMGLGLADLPARLSSDVFPYWLTSNLAPSLAMAVAKLRPRPLAPPVTIQAFPARRFIVSSFGADQKQSLQDRPARGQAH